MDPQELLARRAATYNNPELRALADALVNADEAARAIYDATMKPHIDAYAAALNAQAHKLTAIDRIIRQARPTGMETEEKDDKTQIKDAAVRRLSLRALIKAFEGLIGNTNQESPTVRMWIMDELERRDEKAFQHWLMSDDHSPRAHYLVTQEVTQE